MLASERRDSDRAHGRGACPWLEAGMRFELEGHPVERLNRNYVVASIEHEGSFAFPGLFHLDLEAAHAHSMDPRPGHTVSRPCREIVQPGQPGSSGSGSGGVGGRSPALRGQAMGVTPLATTAPGAMPGRSTEGCG